MTLKSQPEEEEAPYEHIYVPALWQAIYCRGSFGLCLQNHRMARLDGAMTAQVDLTRFSLLESGKARRREVYNAILKYKIEHKGKSPTIRELCQLTTVTSTSLMNYILRRLETQGAVRITRRLSTRGIELIGEAYVAPEPVEIK